MNDPAESAVLPMLTDDVLAAVADDMPEVDGTNHEINEDLIPLEERPVVDFQPDLEGGDI